MVYLFFLRNDRLEYMVAECHASDVIREKQKIQGDPIYGPLYTFHHIQVL